MPSLTPNYNLYIYNTTTDGSSTFISFRDNIAGIGVNSNMVKIDTALAGISGSVVTLGLTKGAILLTMTYAGTNAYTASSAAITSLYAGLTIIGVPNQNSDATMQLTINSLSAISLMKANSSGTYVNIAANDLVVGRAYYFVYDGTRFVWVNATSADQIETSGSSGNLLMISSGSGIVDSTYSATSTPTANKIPISSSGSVLDTWISDATTSTKGIASFNTDNFTVSSGSVVVKSSGINHLLVSGSGTNTHAQIDSHIANISNPHSTTASQVNAIPNVSASVVGNVLTSNGSNWVSSVPSGGGSNSICDGRLTLGSGSPVTTTDQTSKTSVYFTPYTGNKIALYDGSSAWNARTFSELSLSLSGLDANCNHDIFAYDNSGTATLESLSWGINTAYNITAATAANPVVITYSNSAQIFAAGDIVCIQGITGNIGSDILHATHTVSSVATVSAGVSYSVTLQGVNTTGKTYTSGGTIRLNKNTRATSVIYQDGVLVKSGATTRRYLGTIRTTGASGTTEDSQSKRFIWNYYNRDLRSFFIQEPSSSWSYSVSAIVRQANNNYLNKVETVIGYSEDAININILASCVVTGSGISYGFVGVGEDSITTMTDTGFFQGGGGLGSATNNYWFVFTAALVKIPSAGYHYYSWNEQIKYPIAVTFYGGSTSNSAEQRAGIYGFVKG